MFDFAALGTLRIGLDAADAEPHTTRHSRSVAAPRRGLSIRAALAQSLRRVAAVLEPRTSHEVGA